MSVLVCIPTDRDIDSRTVEAAFAICANHAGGASFRTVRAHPTDRCREQCVELFLASSHSHLFFIDSDVVPPPDALERMLATERPLVTGIYPIMVGRTLCAAVARRVGPDAYGFFHDFPDEPFEADAAGLGCCLIAREVFERVPAPWFRFVSRPDGHQTGEDIWFFERCAEADIKPIVVPDVLCAHHRSTDLLDVFTEVRSLRRAAKPTTAAG